MCNFFSFATDPVHHPAEYYYFDWGYRKAHLDDDGVDSHSHICAHFKLTEDVCNKYEYNPLTGEFIVGQINSERDDREVAEKWVNRLDFKTVVEPLVIKPIVNPLELPEVTEVTAEHIQWLKEWIAVSASLRASVLDSVWESVGNLVWDSVWYSVWDSVWASVWASVVNSVSASLRASVGDSVWNSVGDSVWNSVGGYISSFISIEYERDYSSAVKLWESGLVPSFDGTTWRLHTGKSADIVYEWTPEVQE